VLGFAASAAASDAVGGRTKRARGVGGAPDSDETDEDGMETESEEEEEEDEEDMDVDALAARVTIVFEGGRAGALPGYVFLPTFIYLFLLIEVHAGVDSSMNQTRFVRPFCTRRDHHYRLVRPSLRACASGNA
jgi:hypothetical protein